MNSKDVNGRTALWHAAQNGLTEIVEMLLRRYHVDVASANSIGVTPLMTAAKFGRKDVVELLLQQAMTTIDQKDEGGRTGLS